MILPQFGGYWIEDAEAAAGTPTSSESSFCEDDDGGGMSPGGGFGFRLECNSTARAFRKHFLGRVSEASGGGGWVRSVGGVVGGGVGGGGGEGGGRGGRGGGEGLGGLL